MADTPLDPVPPVDPAPAPSPPPDPLPTPPPSPPHLVSAQDGESPEKTGDPGKDTFLDVSRHAQSVDHDSFREEERHRQAAVVGDASSSKVTGDQGGDVRP